MTQLMSPHVQQHQKEVAAAEVSLEIGSGGSASQVKGLPQMCGTLLVQAGLQRASNESSISFLLTLPDSVLELVALYAPAASTAKMQATCQHLHSLLSDDW